MLLLFNYLFCRRIWILFQIASYHFSEKKLSVVGLRNGLPLNPCRQASTESYFKNHGNLSFAFWIVRHWLKINSTNRHIHPHVTRFFWLSFVTPNNDFDWAISRRLYKTNLINVSSSYGKYSESTLIASYKIASKKAAKVALCNILIISFVHISIEECTECAQRIVVSVCPAS